MKVLERKRILEIDSHRLLRRIAELSQIGRDPAGGITRPGFSAADRQARSYLIAQGMAQGLMTSVDAAGNVLLRRPGAAVDHTGKQIILMGSHLDTVIQGGRLDGAYGVLAALEVLQTIAEGGLDTRYEPVVVAFANEEGALFHQPFWGSMVLSGHPVVTEHGPDGSTNAKLRDAIALAGGDLGALASAVWPPDAVAAYLELHIEQGPILERDGHSIGIVTAITGRTVLSVEVSGEAAHAGTTPMDARRDALAAAAHLLVSVERLAQRHGLCRVATVGNMDIHPNSPNTIADRVKLTVDLRDVDPGKLALAEAVLRNSFSDVARRTGTGVRVVHATRSEPASTDAGLQSAIRDSADELALSSVLLPSGAGHDAQMMARIAPIGMIFVPSIGGVSHVPEEDTASADLASGAQVLLRTVLKLMAKGSIPFSPSY